MTQDLVGRIQVYWKRELNKELVMTLRQEKLSVQDWPGLGYLVSHRPVGVIEQDPVSKAPKLKLA